MIDNSEYQVSWLINVSFSFSFFLFIHILVGLTWLSQNTKQK